RTTSKPDTAGSGPWGGSVGRSGRGAYSTRPRRRRRRRPSPRSPHRPGDFGGPLGPGKIDLYEACKLKEFKGDTNTEALVGTVSRIEEVMPGILRNLTNQIRQMKPMQRTDKMDQAEKITKPLRTQKQHHLNPEKMMTFRNELKDQDKQTPPQ